ncbi:hypothetical protein [Actinopolymorpha pittospori]
MSDATHNYGASEPFEHEPAGDESAAHADLGRIWARNEVALRAFRLMAVYEHLRLAVDWMSAELKAQERLFEDFPDAEGAQAVMADAAAMTAAILAERDHAAEVVCSIFGETAFKTGEVHAAFHKVSAVLDDIAREAGENRAP